MGNLPEIGMKINKIFDTTTQYSLHVCKYTVRPMGPRWSAPFFWVNPSPNRHLKPSEKKIVKMVWNHSQNLGVLPLVAEFLHQLRLVVYPFIPSLIRMVVLNIPSGAGFLPSTVGCPAGSDRSDRVVSWFVSSIYGTKPTYSPIFQFPIYLESSSQLHSYISGN